MKILVIGPDFHDYNYSIARAFKEFDYEVDILNYSFPRKLNTLIKYYALTKTGRIKTHKDLEIFKFKLNYNIIQSYNKNLLSKVKITSPDIILVLKGDTILPQSIKKIREKTNTIPILWCYDNVEPILNILKAAKYYTLVYVFDHYDISVLKRYNIRSKFLPIGYDPNHYKKLPNFKKNIDISFVGILEGRLQFDYRIRDKLLTKIVKKYPKVDLKVFGKSWVKSNIFGLYKYKIKNKKLGKCIHNHNLSHEEVNKIYNTSHICLNIHRSEQNEALNPRTFEILGAGGFQLVDYRKKLEDLFDIGKEIESYKNDADLLDKIGFYLDNKDETKKIAKKGNIAVRKKHTFKHRAENIINDIEKIR